MLSERKRKPRTESGKRLRRLNRYFDVALPRIRDAINQAASLSPEDAKRILRITREQADTAYEFPLILNSNGRATKANNKVFESWATGYAERLARLTIAVRQVIPTQLSQAAYDRVSNVVLDRLHRYVGDPDDVESVGSWVADELLRDSQRTDHFNAWFKTYKRAVYKGIWSVVKPNLDLIPGQAGTYAAVDTVRELANDCWLWIANNVDQFLKSEAPLEYQFWYRGYWTAREWKTGRLRALGSEEADTDSTGKLVSLDELFDADKEDVGNVIELVKPYSLDLWDAPDEDGDDSDPEFEDEDDNIRVILFPEHLQMAA